LGWKYCRGWFSTSSGTERKALFGPIKVFTIQGNLIWIIAHGDTRKIPRCNIKLCGKNEDVVDEEKVSGNTQKVSAKFHKSKGINDQESSEEKEEVKENGRMWVQPMDREKNKDFKLDNVSIF